MSKTYKYGPEDKYESEGRLDLDKALRELGEETGQDAWQVTINNNTWYLRRHLTGRLNNDKGYNSRETFVISDEIIETKNLPQVQGKNGDAKAALFYLQRYSALYLEADVFLKRYSQRVEVGSLAAEPLGNSADDEQFRKNGYGARVYSAPISIHCIDGISIHGRLRVSGKIILESHLWLKETSIITDTATQHDQPIPRLNPDYDHILSELRPDISDALRADYPNIEGIALYHRCLFHEGNAQSLMTEADAKRISDQVDKIVRDWQAHSLVLETAQENPLLKTLLEQPVVASIQQIVNLATRRVVNVADKTGLAYMLEVRIPTEEWSLFQAVFSRKTEPYNDYQESGSPSHWLVNPDELTTLLAQHEDSATWQILHERYCAFKRQQRLPAFIDESKRLVKAALEGLEYQCPPQTSPEGKRYFLDHKDYNNLAHGSGEYYTITEDTVWHVSNKGMDDDNCNNIRTSAIDHPYLKTDELVALIQARTIVGQLANQPQDTPDQYCSRVALEGQDSP